MFGQILEATFYWRQVKLPQVSAGWITTNKVSLFYSKFLLIFKKSKTKK